MQSSIIIDSSTVDHEAATAAAPIEWQVERELTAALLADVQQLWRRDPFASPFASAEYLRRCAEDARDEGAAPLFVRGVAANHTVGLWPLRLDRGGVLRFLQGDDADHCTGLAGPGIDASTFGEGFTQALRAARPARVAMTNLPPWGPTREAVLAGLRQSGWPARAFAATSCPVLSVEPGPGAARSFVAAINSHKRLRNYENRFKRLAGYRFEAIDHGDGLDEWADEFCNIHEWRWNTTDTPSEFRRQDARARLVRQMSAWHRDGVLYRFAMRGEGRPIALAIALVGGGRVVYHRPVAAPAWAELRPGHVLLRLMGLWMGERGLHVLDFGMGNEDYKSRYANQDEKLWRIYAGPRHLSLGLARGILEQQIRNAPAAEQLWDRTVNGFIRGRLRRAVSDARSRLQRRRTGWSDTRSPAGSWRQSSEIVYRSFAAKTASPPEVDALGAFDALERIDDGVRLTAAERAAVIERLHRGDRLFGVLEGERIAASAWLLEETRSDSGEPRSPSYRVEPYALSPAGRRPGVIAKLLEGMAAHVEPGAAIAIVVADRSPLVRSELARAGFTAVGVAPARRFAEPVRRSAGVAEPAVETADAPLA